MNADYRRGYLDALFEKPRIKNDTFMYSRGYDAGLIDLAEFQATEKETS